MGDGCRLTRDAYERLISEDIAWLYAAAPKSLERDHVRDVLLASAEHEYPETPPPGWRCPECAIVHAPSVERCVCRRMLPDTLASVIAFARETWPNSGAEGATVHALCDAVLSATGSSLSASRELVTAIGRLRADASQWSTTEQLADDDPQCEYPVCARCDASVMVETGLNWEHGDLCHSCLAQIAAELVPLLLRGAPIRPESDVLLELACRCSAEASRQLDLADRGLGYPGEASAAMTAMAQRLRDEALKMGSDFRGRAPTGDQTQKTAS